MTMKERLRSRVAELTSIIGVSGHEWDVAKYIFDAIKDDVDTIEQLPNGIIVATIPAPGLWFPPIWMKSATK